VRKKQATLQYHRAILLQVHRKISLVETTVDKHPKNVFFTYIFEVLNTFSRLCILGVNLGIS